VIGIGTESQLPNWNTTDSGFQETARVFNDLIMPANELAFIKGGKKDAYNRIRQLTYWFSEGRDTSRNSASQYAIAAVSSIWRGILVSTAENSFGDLARIAGIDHFQEWFRGKRNKGCRRDLDYRSGRACNSDFLLVARSHRRAGHGRCNVYRGQLPR
jgi:hypothetical protein